MEAREDAELGADAFNAETFGEDAGAGWSFEENLKANLQLQKSQEAEAHRVEAAVRQIAEFDALRSGGWPLPGGGAGGRRGAPRGRRQRWRLADAATRFRIAVGSAAGVLQSTVGEVSWIEVRGDNSVGWTITLHLSRGPRGMWSQQLLAFAEQVLCRSAMCSVLGGGMLGYSAGGGGSPPSFTAVLFNPACTNVEAMEWTGVTVELKRQARAIRRAAQPTIAEIQYQ